MKRSLRDMVVTMALMAAIGVYLANVIISCADGGDIGKVTWYMALALFTAWAYYANEVNIKIKAKERRKIHRSYNKFVADK